MNRVGQQAASPGKVPWHSSRVVVGKAEVHSREWNFNLELSVEVAKKAPSADPCLHTSDLSLLQHQGQMTP